MKIEHERLKWMMSDMYSREREQGSTQLGYAYGHYTPKDKTWLQVNGVTRWQPIIAPGNMPDSLRRNSA
ncbi:hypothetical protein VC34_17900 [Pseudomonas fluorescens]|uniref:DUF551 domain-containing protein n=1 Tax=Pseudomonas fluorescens TaxID=294 RepID=A0A0F4TC19_PSEFL|nr:hypothetical protein VC34_17900 [Pseudomonas fluorescens]